MTAARARTRSGGLQVGYWDLILCIRPVRFHAVAFGRKTRAGLVTAARAHTRSGGLQAEDLGTGYFESGRFASILLRSDGRRGPA